MGDFHHVQLRLSFIELKSVGETPQVVCIAPQSSMDKRAKTSAGDVGKEMGKDVVNTFTVERDTSLADGAGAPGSTSVGGSASDERGSSTPATAHGDDELRNVRPDEAVD
jgi:hypothetical protein